MYKSWLALAACAALAAPAGAIAGVGAGDFEAGVSISLSEEETSVDSDDGFGGTCTTDTTITSGSVGANVGYFITDIIELKGAATAVRSGTESGGTCGGGGTSTPTTTLGVLSPGVDFVFLGTSGKVAPFVGGAYGLTFGDTAGVDTDYFDVHGGAKFFISERATIELKLTRFEPTDSAAGGRTELAAGLNVYF